MADSVRFIFGVHNHQPVGNFDSVFREAFEKSYRPFVDVAEHHPSVALNFHFSGPLLEWIEANERSFLDRIGQLVQRGNVEVLSGGFYEPVLSAIPDRDKIGQINKLTRYVKERFGYTAEGLWLAERVWEPQLAKPIREAGINYAAVDDYHFLSTGLQGRDLTGYFLTEEQNQLLGMFPISQRLRYAIPFKDPEETLAVLRQAAGPQGDAILVMVDDGEKFGLWPGTHGRCYGRDRWLERFFIALEENSDWITSTTFRDIFHGLPPRGRVYLPTASYFEMSQWTLQTDSGKQLDEFIRVLEKQGRMDEVRPFVHGGIWRNFLAKYDESNWMQKRATQVSAKLAHATENLPDNEQLSSARDDLWRSQCNCAYWHGIFGGLYLPHLRHGVFEHLLKAEAAVDVVDHGVRFNREDVDLDGVEEVELATPRLRAFLTPRGGALRELDVLPAHFNLLNTLRRYRESYHRKIKAAPAGNKTEGSIHEPAQAKEPDLERYLQVDEYPRYALMDHFYPLDASVEEVQFNRVSEMGTFLDTMYNVDIDGDKVKFSARGRAFNREVGLVKTIRPWEETLEIDLQIINYSDSVLEGFYAMEFHFSMLGGHTKDRFYLVNGAKPENPFLDATGMLDGVKSIGLVTEWERVQVDLTFGAPTTVWRYPVMTVSMSEGGYERIYQGSVVLPVYRLNVPKDGEFTARFSLRASTHK